MKNGKDKLIKEQLMRELEDGDLDQVTGGDGRQLSEQQLQQLQELLQKQSQELLQRRQQKIKERETIIYNTIGYNIEPAGAEGYSGQKVNPSAVDRYSPLDED